ncbi:MAG: serine/threonine protein kinase [Chloracidobacterium sp.]|nr:serine/threonine protein kinase [Chloracidobacterium sp.]
MGRSDWERVKEIFVEAGELAPDGRVAFLDEACGGDAELRSEVESLLAEHDEADDSFERNAVDLTAAIKGDREKYAGRQFGHFEIISELGAGGMGTVFLAKRSDGEFDQQIALKVIRNTIIDAETERRFRRERQILADLNHPNIAKLIDGGVSDDGEPFLAMEYVEGRSLIESCDNAGLDVTARLRLFTRICSAVSYAHQNLVVHRDIKPGNILVTANGEPKLLDFGLAKIVDQNIFEAETTATVNRAFTPAYASPEQFLGKHVTTRSDVYSLGVVLFELLTGRKPYDFDGRSLDEIIRTMSDSEPPRPSDLGEFGGDRGPTLKGDLDNIVLKAIQKDETQRYSSVDELTNDIERYLAGRPVSARPATITYRAAKFFRRNRIAVSAAAAVLIALILGLVVTLWQYNVARRERDLAEQRFNDVRRLSNSLLFEIAPEIESLPGSLAAREIILKRAVEYLDSLASQSQNDLQLQAELASAYQKIGDLQGNPANPNFIMLADAIGSYEKALAIRKAILNETPNDNDLRWRTAENHRLLGRVLAETNDYDGEQSHMLAARQMLEELLARDNSD